MKWDYFMAHCRFEAKCKECKDQHGKPQAHWVLDVFDGKHHWLQNGLKLLGAQGWELVAVQQEEHQWEDDAAFLPGAKVIRGHLPYWYVFKRPLPE